MDQSERNLDFDELRDNYYNRARSLGEKHHYYEVPCQAVSPFVGRHEMLHEIDNELNSTESCFNPRAVVLFGQGGCGKTQLALQYAMLHRDEYSAIFWVNASSKTTIDESYGTIARLMCHNSLKFVDLEASAQYVVSVLRKRTGRWLLVFDNFGNLDTDHGLLLNDYYPQGLGGAIIFTTRRKGASLHGSIIDVSAMGKSDAVRLLLQKAKMEDDSIAGKSEEEKIVDRLGYLALAIDQAGSYISDRRMDLSGFLESYEEQERKIMEVIPDSSEYAKELTVFTTWEMSFSQIAPATDEGGWKAHFLTLSAFLDPTCIAEDLFKDLHDTGGQKYKWINLFIMADGWDHDKFSSTLTSLQKLSLLQSQFRNAGSLCFSLHPLVRDWLKIRCQQDQRTMFRNEAFFILATSIYRKNWADSTEDTISKAKQFLLHMDALQRTENDMFGANNLAQREVQYGAACFINFYAMAGRQEDEKRVLEKCEQYAASIDEGGLDHLPIITRLASIVLFQGLNEEAKVLYTRLQQMILRRFGPAYGDYVQITVTLGNIEERQGHFKEAASLYEECLKSMKNEVAAEDSIRLTILLHLAHVRATLNDTDAVENIYYQVMEIINSPQNVLPLAALGDAYDSHELLMDAEHYYCRLIELEEPRLAPGNNLMILAKSSVADVYRKERRFKEAEDVFLKILEVVNDRAAKNSHPLTSTLLFGLGRVYLDQQHWIEAEPHYVTAILLEKQLMGSRFLNPVLLADLAKIYKAQGKSDLAKATLEELAEMCRKERDDQAPLLEQTLLTLAEFHRKQGKDGYHKARELYTRLENTSLLAPEDARRLVVKLGLAKISENEGQLESAAAKYREVIHWCLNSQDPNSYILSKLRSMIGLVEINKKLGRTYEANYLDEEVRKSADVDGEASGSLSLDKKMMLAQIHELRKSLDDASHLYEEVLEQGKKYFEQDQQGYLQVKMSLARVQEEQGRWEDAETSYKAILKLPTSLYGQHHKPLLRARLRLSRVCCIQGRSPTLSTTGYNLVREEVSQSMKTLFKYRKDLLDETTFQFAQARVLEEQGDLRRAGEFYDKMIETVEFFVGKDYRAAKEAANPGPRDGRGG